MIEEKYCPLCKGTDHKSLKDLVVDESWRICYCGMIFQSPHKSIEELADHYVSGYRAVEYPTEHDIRIQTRRAKRQTEFIKDNKVWPSNVLDIGCASGILLNEMRKEFACAVVGVELNPADHVEAAKRNVTIYSTLEELPRQRFDLILLSHMLEHLPKPIEWLEMLRDKWLVSRGYIYTEMPNNIAQSAWEDVHLCVFSPNTLAYVFVKAGLYPTKRKLINKKLTVMQLARLP